MRDWFRTAMILLWYTLLLTVAAFLTGVAIELKGGFGG